MQGMSTAFDPRPVTLEGEHVRLEPVGPRHAGDLLAAGGDLEAWHFMPVPPPRDLDEMKQWIETAAAATLAGQEIAFAIIEAQAGRAVGSTRFLDIRRRDRALEIGWTWLAAGFQRTAVNTESKLLLLGHAFEDLGAVRVQLKTDRRNLVSQKAIERLGAVREGVLRHNRLNWDGHWRDTVYYSILESEWPHVKRRLLAFLGRTEYEG